MENLQHCVSSLLQEKSNHEVILDIGCGPSKLVGSIGIDFLPYIGVDLVGDACDILFLFPDKSVDYLYTRHFLEHANDLNLLISEFCRVLKDESCAEIIVPHFSNPYFYSDPTHKNAFGLYTFCYYSFSGNLFKRKVPTYMRELSLDLISVHLSFQTHKRYSLRSALKKLVQLLVNGSSLGKELYEELFCFIFPCYEIKYRLVKRSKEAKSILLD